jgi:hypothetical protein
VAIYLIDGVIFSFDNQYIREELPKSSDRLFTIMKSISAILLLVLSVISFANLGKSICDPKFGGECDNGILCHDFANSKFGGHNFLCICQKNWWGGEESACLNEKKQPNVPQEYDGYWAFNNCDISK